jgi:DNA-binding response OmpR family regulator
VTKPVQPAVPAGPPKPVADPGNGARTVMVVEDDPSIREMLVRSLGGEHCVYEAGDGRMALDILAAIKVPDLIVSDIMMPRMDGMAFIAAVKADPRLKMVPVIFLTGLDSPKDVVNGINVGVRHYLTKPFKIQELIVKVSKAIGPKR